MGWSLALHIIVFVLIPVVVGRAVGDWLWCKVHGRPNLSFRPPARRFGSLPRSLFHSSAGPRSCGAIAPALGNDLRAAEPGPQPGGAPRLQGSDRIGQGRTVGRPVPGPAVLGEVGG